MNKKLTRGELTASLVIANFVVVFALFGSEAIGPITAFGMFLGLCFFIYAWSNAPKDTD